MKEKCWFCDEVKECLHKVYTREKDGSIGCHPLCRMCKLKLDELSKGIDFRGN